MYIVHVNPPYQGVDNDSMVDTEGITGQCSKLLSMVYQGSLVECEVQGAHGPHVTLRGRRTYAHGPFVQHNIGPVATIPVTPTPIALLPSHCQFTSQLHEVATVAFKGY